MLECPLHQVHLMKTSGTSSRLSDYSLVKEHIKLYVKTLIGFAALFSANADGNFRYRRRVTLV
jgi:hypothetical protein